MHDNLLPRRGFLTGAIGAAAGALPLTAAPSAQARIGRHLAEVEKAFAELHPDHHLGEYDLVAIIDTLGRGAGMVVADDDTRAGW